MRSRLALAIGVGGAACLQYCLAERAGPTSDTKLERPRTASPNLDPYGITQATPVRRTTSSGDVNTSRPIVVGIAGGTGSGKTTVARAIAERLGAENLLHISHDSYYKDLSHLSFEERAQVNFDHPDSLDSGLMVQHLHALRAGEQVEVPVYNYATHMREQGQTQKVFIYIPRLYRLCFGALMAPCPSLTRAGKLGAHPPNKPWAAGTWKDGRLRTKCMA